MIDKVRANAQYYYDWMKRSQLGMSLAYAFFPAQMLTLLQFGWLFYTHGSLSAETFITVIILSLEMAAPIVAAFNFVDTLAQVGTTVAQVNEILKAEEQDHAERSVSFSNHDIEVKNVTFGYHDEHFHAAEQHDRAGRPIGFGQVHPRKTRGRILGREKRNYNHERS